MKTPSKIQLARIARFVDEHDRLISVEADHVVVADPWTHAETGEIGTEYVEVRSLSAARRVLGY